MPNVITQISDIPVNKSKYKRERFNPYQQFDQDIQKQRDDQRKQSLIALQEYFDSLNK